MEGYVGKLSGNIYIGVDVAKDCDTCVEYEMDSNGVITVLDIYKSNERIKT